MSSHPGPLVRFQLAHPRAGDRHLGQRPSATTDATGRDADNELYFVPMLAEAWDYFQSGSGKVVWAENPCSFCRRATVAETRPNLGQATNSSACPECSSSRTCP